MTRLVITGVPRSGKTSYADHRRWGADMLRGGEPGFVRHTDDLIHVGWSRASELVSLEMGNPGPWIIEGVAAVRALRKWLARVHPQQDAKPCDHVIWLGTPRVALTCGQARMAAGCLTVWREIKPLLVARNVLVEEA